MERLLAGYRRFRESDWPEQRQSYEALAKHGQRPETLIVACVDSRVDPAVIFDAAPGEMLTIRNVANLIPPYAPDVAYHGTSAALEFGVRVLDVRQIIVLGHGSCGGVHALLEGAPVNASDFVAGWMSIAEPARERTNDQSKEVDRQQFCEHEVVKVSLTNLLTFPWIVERIRDGRLKLHGAWFSVLTGELMILQPDGSFAAA